MIYDSSKDYGTGEVTLVFDGETPDRQTINEFVKRNYGFYPNDNYTVNLPSDFNGLYNPGIVIVNP